MTLNDNRSNKKVKNAILDIPDSRLVVNNSCFYGFYWYYSLFSEDFMV